jgi:hypothetical protein
MRQRNRQAAIGVHDMGGSGGLGHKNTRKKEKILSG